MAEIFISYSHKDKAYAHALEAELKRRGHEVFIDDRIDYGSQWPMVLQENLDACKALLLVMSPHSMDSDWVQNELGRAKRTGKVIFPLLLAGDGPWLSVEATQYVDVRSGKLPPARFFDQIREALSAGRPVERPPAVDPKIRQAVVDRIEKALQSALQGEDILAMGIGHVTVYRTLDRGNRPVFRARVTDFLLVRRVKSGEREMRSWKLNPNKRSLSVLDSVSREWPSGTDPNQIAEEIVRVNEMTSQELETLSPVTRPIGQSDLDEILPKSRWS